MFIELIALSLLSRISICAIKISLFRFQVDEIAGFSQIYRNRNQNQDLFRNLENADIDLENIVYYKDKTHYFVMTAKKGSLLKRGVLKKVCTRVFHKHTELAIMSISASEALLPENKTSSTNVTRVSIEPITSVIQVQCSPLCAIKACATWDVLKLSFVPAPL